MYHNQAFKYKFSLSKIHRIYYIVFTSTNFDKLTNPTIISTTKFLFPYIAMSLVLVSSELEIALVKDKEIYITQSEDRDMIGSQQYKN